jgi:hypothetical protein
MYFPRYLTLADFYANDPSAIGAQPNLSAGGFPRATAGGGSGDGSDVSVAGSPPPQSVSGGNEASVGNSGGLPPLRELIWRRLRRRNAQLSLLDDEIGAETNGGENDARSEANRERARHRELLSWMVDQLTIDQVGFHALLLVNLVNLAQKNYLYLIMVFRLIRL